MEQQKGKWDGEKIPSSKRAKTEDEDWFTPSLESKPVPAAVKGDGGDTSATGEEAAKSVCLFYAHLYGPNAHALYAVDILLPDLPTITLVSDPPCSERITPHQVQPLCPLVEFPFAKYALGMWAVEFDSKLYILGGKFVDPSLGGPLDHVDCPYPKDVHIFDPACPFSLKVGPKMNAGKSRPYAFVADSKIYVLDGESSETNNQNLSRFEVFKPDNCDPYGGGTWTQLEDIPFPDTAFMSHIVVNRKVFISTFNSEFLCFDLDSSTWWHKIWGDDSCYWTKLSEEGMSYRSIWGSPENDVSPPFGGSAELVDGTLYCCSSGNSVVSFGPLVADNNNNNDDNSKEEEMEEVKFFEEKLFDRVAFLSPDVVQILHPIVSPVVALTHMGKRLFCHVLSGNPKKSNTPYPYAADPTRCYVNLTMFEAMEDTCYSEEVRCTFFSGKFLHSALLVITTEHYGSFLFGAFTLPSSRETADSSMVSQ